MDGLEVIPLPAGLTPIMEALDSDSDFFPDAVEVGDMGFTTAPESSLDSDLDGVRDESDLCPFVFDANNHDDSGGLLSTDADGIGDDCQCGDSDESGALLLTDVDLALIQDYLVGKSVASEVREFCSVAQGIECNLLDAVMLQLALEGQLTAEDLGQVCERAVEPVIGP